MENSNTQPQAKKVIYTIYGTIGVLLITLVISLFSNVSKADKIAVIEKDVATLQYTLKVHDSTATAHISGLNAAIYTDSVKLATDKEAASNIAKSVAEIDKALAVIKK